MNKTHWILFVAALAIVYLLGIWTGKAIYDKPINGKVESDTIIVHDTVPDTNPTPKDSARIKWVTRWLPSKTDTITQWKTITKHDSVAVEVPIMQKHYGNETYDAWVSGYEPNLDSIKVYQRTEYINTTITQVKPPNKFSLVVNAGIDYGTTSKFWQPYASGELTLNSHKRLQLGIEGGVKKNEVTKNFEPFAGFNAKIKLY